MRILLAVSIVALLFPLRIEAGSGPVAQVKKSELARAPFISGSLRITVSSFDEKVGFGGGLGQGTGKVTLEIENTSNDFSTFDPHRFSFVDRNKEQIDVLDLRHSSHENVPASIIRIAPGARVKETYRLKDEVRLPASLFYDDKPLALITN